MAEALVKIGDNFPHKDIMIALAATDQSAKEYWIEREAKTQYIVCRVTAKNLPLTQDNLIAEAVERWEESKHCYRHGEIVKVRPDGWEWGNRESYPRFYIIRIPDNQLPTQYTYQGIQQQIRAFAEPYWMPDNNRLVTEIDEITSKPISHLAPLYYHRRLYHIPDIDTLAHPDKIVELPNLSEIVQRSTGYEEYDSAKSTEHHSAGTFTIKSSGGDYTDISNWDAGEACDLTGAGQSIAECYDEWASGLDDKVDISTDWTAPDADNCPVITVAAGNRHDGVVEGGFFIVSTDITDYPWIKVGCANFIQKYVEVQAPNCGVNTYVFYLTSTANVVVTENNLIHNINDGIGLQYNFNSSKHKNIIAYDLGGYGFQIRYGSVYSGSFYSPGYNNSGAWGRYGTNDDEMLLRDVACYDVVVWNGNSVHDSYGTYYNCTGDYNCSDDTSSPGANSQDNKSLDDIDFVSTTYGSEDLLIQGTSCLIDAGVGSGTYAEVLDVDIEGDARPSGTCDIGADEYVAAGGGLSISVSETITSTESLTESMPLGEILKFDNVTISEFRALLVSIAPLVFKNISISEYLSLIISIKPDIHQNINITEAITILKDIGVDVNEQISIQEIIAILLEFSVNISENVQLQEFVDLAISGAGEISKSETISIVEALTMVLPLGGISAFEAIELIEYIKVSLPISTTIIQQLTVQEYLSILMRVSPNVFENFGVSEFAQLLMNISPDIFESINISEYTAATVGAVSINVSVYDVLSVVENIVMSMSMSTTISQVIQVTESIIVLLNPLIFNQSEVISIVESVTVLVGILAVGRVTATITSKAPGATITSKAPGATFS